VGEVLLEGEQVVEVEVRKEGDALADRFRLLLCLCQAGDQLTVEGLDVVDLPLETLQLSSQLPHGRTPIGIV
jgi:hypothetical protein